jgi:hypothetical protein
MIYYTILTRYLVLYSFSAAVKRVSTRKKKKPDNIYKVLKPLRVSSCILLLFCQETFKVQKNLHTSTLATSNSLLASVQKQKAQFVERKGNTEGSPALPSLSL